MVELPEHTGTRRVIVAPDKFKGTLTGPAAAAAMAAGVQQVWPHAQVELLPLADGGEGTVDAVLTTGARAHAVSVPGPLGDPVEARFAMLGSTAVIESAQACGLHLVSPSRQSSRQASSAGVGTLVRAAWEAGAEEIVVGLGGVASTDGGAGLITALGGRLLDEHGEPVLPGALHRTRALDLTGLDARVATTRFVAATDVTNPLLGHRGAAPVYAPQKGAEPPDVAELASGLRALAEVTESVTGRRLRDRPGAGAAGGLGWALMVVLGAQVQSGAELIMEQIGAPAALTGADLAITGEGRLDAQSSDGKAPVALATLARRVGVPTLAIAGTVAAEARTRRDFAGVWSLTEEVGAQAALAHPADSLREVTARAVHHWTG